MLYNIVNKVSQGSYAYGHNAGTSIRNVCPTGAVVKRSPLTAATHVWYFGFGDIKWGGLFDI